MSTAILMCALFFAKVVDNALSTTKTILVQRNHCILAGIALAASNFIYLCITKNVVNSDSSLALIVVSVASGVGCCLAVAVSSRLSKEKTYVNVIMSDKDTFMSTTLFFAKLNLASEEIYNIYKEPKKRIELKFALSESLRRESSWEKEQYFMDAEGNPRVKKIEYKLNLLSIDPDINYAEGWVYKKSALHYNSLVSGTNQLLPQTVDNTEAIRFYFDLNNELVGYDTKSRFGYKEFLDAFAHLINQGLSEYNPVLYFTISLIRLMR